MDRIADYLREAERAFNRKTFDESERRCRRVLATEPKDSRAWNLLGRSQMALGAERDCFEPLCRALVLEPDNLAYREDLERALRRARRRRFNRVARGIALRDHLRSSSPGDRNGDRTAAERSSSGSIATAVRSPIHIITPLGFLGGTQMQAVATALDLSGHAEVSCWSGRAPLKVYEDQTPIRVITTDDYPREGTFIFYGVYWSGGEWVKRAQPSRVYLHFTTMEPVKFLKWLGVLSRWRDRPIEVVCPSERIRQVFDCPGFVEPSPIDITSFRPRLPAVDDGAARPFTVGRMSRDDIVKHHPDDASVYATLANDGINVRIMGGGCLGSAVSELPGTQILPHWSLSGADFLQSLDCFYYRTGLAVESWGRVVIEAMACGLPVVCHSSGGYAEAIRHGENGFLFETTEEAIAIVTALRSDPEHRRRIGHAARASTERLFSSESRARFVEMYLRP